jgi:uncharacterized Zn-binding protein involved in type VI secretion
MPSVARVLDITGHGKPPPGTPLFPGPGSLNVLINGRPAWLCLLDVHICSDHGPGTVLIGSKTVFINSRPVARVGDTIIEGIPPNVTINVIMTGSPTVNIGT